MTTTETILIGIATILSGALGTTVVILLNQLLNATKDNSAQLNKIHISTELNAKDINGILEIQGKHTEYFSKAFDLIDQLEDRVKDLENAA